jgi:RNA polymerase sigma-70 factor (ECF subfamily)
VFTVARNLLVSWRRRETLGVNKLLQIFATRVATPAPDPLTACEGNEASVRIERALGDLRPPDRELLLLAAEGFAPSELADLLGLRPEAARQRLARARARLAEALERTPKGGRT